MRSASQARIPRDVFLSLLQTEQREASRDAGRGAGLGLPQRLVPRDFLLSPCLSLPCGPLLILRSFLPPLTGFCGLSDVKGTEQGGPSGDFLTPCSISFCPLLPSLPPSHHSSKASLFLFHCCPQVLVLCIVFVTLSTMLWQGYTAAAPAEAAQRLGPFLASHPPPPPSLHPLSTGYLATSTTTPSLHNGLHQS